MKKYMAIATLIAICCNLHAGDFSSLPKKPRRILPKLDPQLHPLQPTTQKRTSTQAQHTMPVPKKPLPSKPTRAPYLMPPTYPYVVLVAPGMQQPLTPQPYDVTARTFYEGFLLPSSDSDSFNLISNSPVLQEYETLFDSYYKEESSDKPE